MYDTIIFNLTADEMQGANLLNSAPHLTDVVEHTKNGDTWITGNLGCLTFSLNRWSCRLVKGSICKWWNGDNLQALGIGDTKEAVEALSDTLDLPIERAKITRMDIGANISTEHLPALYFERLGNLPYFQRLEEPNGIYYTKTNERLCFYDKITEQKDTGNKLPDSLSDKNLLRYELRYMWRIAKRLKVPEVKFSTLWQDSFYRMIINNWYDYYNRIKKNHSVNLDLNTVKTRRELYKLAVLQLAESNGGITAIQKGISNARAEGAISSKQASDLKRAFDEAYKVDGDIITTSDAIRELNQKIRETADLYTF